MTAIESLIKLIQIDSVESIATEDAPFGVGVKSALDFTLQLCKDFGFKTKNIDGFCGWAEVGEGELFGILTHLDVVPISGNWKYPPFGGVVENGKLYGRGAMDNKGPAIASIYVVKRLLDEGLIPCKRIRLIFGCDEESGWKCIDKYLETEEVPQFGFSPDADFPVINTEKGIVYHSFSIKKSDKIVTMKGGERANMVPDLTTAVVLRDADFERYLIEVNANFTIENDTIKITTSGKSVHGSQPFNGENALLKMLEILSPIDTGLALVLKLFKQWDGSGIDLKISDKESGQLTMNLGVCQSDLTNLNFALDIRHPISYNKDDITKTLNKSGIVFTQTFYHLPLHVDKIHPLVKTLLKAYNDTMGSDAEPICIGGGTYARALPCGVAFGPQFPGTVSTIHSVDECMDLKEFELMQEIFYKAVKELCFL